MKFAKELDENAVPEWRDKYLDYKGGKKKLKAVARALRTVDRPNEKDDNSHRSPFNSLRDAPVYSFLQKSRQSPISRRQQPPRPAAGSADSSESHTPLVEGTQSQNDASSQRPDAATQPASTFAVPGDGVTDATPRSQPRAIPIPVHERSPLQVNRQGQPTMMRYGSIIGSPPRSHETSGGDSLHRPPTLQLPDPALHDSSPTQAEQEDEASVPAFPNARIARPAATADSRMTRGEEGSASASMRQRYPRLFQPRRTTSSPDISNGKPFLRRVFSISTPQQHGQQQLVRNDEISLEAYREVDFRQSEFFLFLDKQLHKIEAFYKEREDEATERLKVLRDQLHILRDQRHSEVMAAENRRLDAQVNGHKSRDASTDAVNGGLDGVKDNTLYSYAADRAQEVLQKVRPGHVGKTSKAMDQLGTPHPSPLFNLQARDARHQDYSRRPEPPTAPSSGQAPPQRYGVAYRTAKRKLKTAMAEYYRSLELLKSYALLNRTAFRKIIKKFDKTVNARPSARYMQEKVNPAHFVKSEMLDGHMQAVEDLYARYFERGNHKIAVNKLRAKLNRGGAFTGPAFRTGLLAAGGAILGIQGLVYGSLQLGHGTAHSTQASFLLQIYGGYFLLLFLMFLFVLDAAIFTKYHVNYQFVFEFDTRHTLDWHELAELPSLFAFLFGLCIWVNFSSFGGGTMFIYWPCVLIGLSALALILPAPVFYARARRWFLFSHWRLLLAGLYPVEFRDFFLGDMFCSQTYAMGNIELFPCLYAQHWSDPAMCNSSHSRLFGFFQCLPGIWRLFQCLRRFKDTHETFPHLANGAKYTCTILAYMSLSLWRLDRSSSAMLALFIAFSSVNSVYCIVWDIWMDWSLPMNPKSKPPLLRSTLAYRKHKWWYYAAIVIDPILRFNWVMYVILKHDTQHSSVVSFLISFSEVCRRGIWVLFRVENEHCTNVVRFRASREAKLPYKIASQETEPEEDPSDESDDDGSEPTSPKGHHHHRPTSAQMLDGSSPVEPNGMVPPGSDTTTTPAPPNSDPATSPSLTRPRPPPRTATATGAASSADIERGPFSLRRRNQTSTMPPASPGVAADANDSPISRALRRVGTTMLTAHARDYERKRKPEDVLDSGRRGSGSGGAGGAKNGGPVAAIDMENVRDDDYDEEDDDEDQDSDDD